MKTPLRFSGGGIYRSGLVCGNQSDVTRTGALKSDRRCADLAVWRGPTYSPCFPTDHDDLAQRREQLDTGRATLAVIRSSATCHHERLIVIANGSADPVIGLQGT